MFVNASRNEVALRKRVAHDVCLVQEFLNILSNYLIDFVSGKMDQAQNVMGERTQETETKQTQGRLRIYIRDREEEIKKFCPQRSHQSVVGNKPPTGIASLRFFLDLRQIRKYTKTRLLFRSRS